MLRRMLRLAKIAFLAAVALLIFMKQRVAVGGLAAIPADFTFLAAALAWAVALATGRARFQWHPAFWALAAFFAAGALSVLLSPDPARGLGRLAAMSYLLALPLLAYNLIDGWADLRRTFIAWLSASAFLALIGVATVALFPLLGPQSILAGPLHRFGTLPPGFYPRLELTFLFPALLANHLTVSMMVLLVAVRLGWIGHRAAALLGGGILVTAFFALTPGFGGLLLAIGAWGWLTLDKRRGTGVLAAGTIGFLAFLLAATVTPVLHRTAPFLIEVAGLPTLAPSVRLMVWTEAIRNWMEVPWFGRGLGVDPVAVLYEYAPGNVGLHTDAHNIFLNIAVQCGLVGLAGLLLVLAVPVRAALGKMASDADSARVGLAIACLSGFAAQGLVGSFEDARHLWVALGMMLAVSKTAFAGRARASTTGEAPPAVVRA